MMGLKLDYGSHSSFKRHGPVPGRLLWHGPFLEYDYQVNVAFNPKEPKPPTPKQDESWRVGIVQNVLFQSIRVRYAKREPLIKRWNSPLLDAGAVDGIRALPFYGPPVPFQVNEDIEGISKTDTLWMFPSADATLDPSGFHVKLPPGARPSPNRSDSDVDLWFTDHPKFDMPLHLDSEKEVLMEFNRLIALQSWVIAIGKGAPVILAESDPFTLVMWMKFPENSERGKALDFSNIVSWDAIPAKDIIKNLPENYYRPQNWDNFVKKYETGVGFHRSNKRQPVLKGPIASDELSKWVQANEFNIPR